MLQKINRFTRILKTREKLREDEQIILARERQEEDVVLHTLAVLKTEKESAFQNFVSISCEGTPMSCQEMWFHRQVLEVIDNHIATEKKSLNTVRKKISDTEERLLERHRDVKIIDKYVDNLKTARVESILSAEQEEMDDLTCTRFDNTKED